MTGDFNIRDSLWDPSFPFHSSISNDLIIIADSFDLSLSVPTNPGPTKFSDTAGELNSVIDLMFLQCGSSELDHHHILPNHHLSSDHAPLIIDIPIEDKFVQSTKFSVIPGSDKGKEFIKDVMSNILTLDTSNINSMDNLIFVVNRLGSIVEQMWLKNSKRTKITKHSKQWWLQSCSLAISKYRESRS